MESNDKNELVELISVYGDMEAEMLRGILELEGITPLAKADVVHNVLPLTVDGLGKVRIYVRRGDLERAREVLEGYGEK